MITRSLLSYEYARGKGVEIGAYHNPFPVREDVKMTYVDKRSYDELIAMRNADPNLNSSLPLSRVDIVDDGETLTNVPRGAFDFVVSSHQLEHCFNPLMALENQLALLKPNGVGIFILPNRDNQIDKNRYVTTLEHLIGHYLGGGKTEEKLKEHFEEYFSVVDHLKGEPLKKRIEDSIKDNSDVHFHVFDSDLVIQMLAWCTDRCEVFSPLFKVELFYFIAAEIFFVLRKTR